MRPSVPFCGCVHLALDSYAIRTQRSVGQHVGESHFQIEMIPFTELDVVREDGLCLFRRQPQDSCKTLEKSIDYGISGEFNVFRFRGAVNPSRDVLSNGGKNPVKGALGLD